MRSSEMFSKNKPSFAQTCNKLSQFLKEKRSLGEFAFSNPMPDMSGAKEICGAGNTMMNLFPNNMEIKEGNVITGDHDLRSLDLFPLMSSSSAVSSDESTKNNTVDHRELETIKEEPKTKTSSMTIFYGGKVLVFDDLSENKAHEIMSLASQGMILPQIPTPTQTQTQTRTQTQTQIPSQTRINNNAIVTEQPSHGPVLLDHVGSSDLLPIARRVSLHRFMEKRKNRIAGSAPYSTQNTSNYDEKYNMMMGNLGQRQKKEFDLNLFQ